MAFWRRTDTSELARTIAKAVQSRESLGWLRDRCTEEESAQYCEDNGIRLSPTNREMLQRHLAHALSRVVLVAIGKHNSVALRGTRCQAEDCFVVHDYMNPWFLFQEHAHHLRHPEKDWEFWYSRPHREWVESLLPFDDLRSNLSAEFEVEYSNWIESRYLRPKATFEQPVKGVLYELRTAT